MRIDNTATVNTVCPQASPMVKGIAPIAACTVALGVYAIMQNSFSFLVSLVFIKDIATTRLDHYSSQVYNADEDVFKYYQFYEAKFGDTFLTLSTCACHVPDGWWWQQAGKTVKRTGKAAI